VEVMRRLSGSGGVAAGQDGLAQPNALLFQSHALLLHTIEQPARPDELGSEDAEPQQDGQPAWAGSDHHNGAEKKQRETENNLQDALCLLHSP